MINNWKMIYYEDLDSVSEVFKFIEVQNERNKVKIFNWLSILEEKGPTLPRPYADFLRNGIHELRIKLTGKQIRILYFFCYQEFIVLTNTFTKKTKKVPEKEIIKALKCKNDFLNRYTELKLREEYDENI